MTKSCYKTVVTNRYYKVRQNLLLSVTGVKKYDRRLLQSVTGLTKRGDYYKGRRTHLFFYNKDTRLFIIIFFMMYLRLKIFFLQ